MGQACCKNDKEMVKPVEVVNASNEAEKKRAAELEEEKVDDRTPVGVVVAGLEKEKEGVAVAAGGRRNSKEKGATRRPSKEAAKPKNDPKEKEKQLMQAAEAAFHKSDWDAAIDAYSQVLQLDPKNGGAWAGRGGAKLRKGAAEESMADLDKALALEPENLFALRDRAEARFKTGDFDGASEDFNKKLSLAPGDGRALCGRGEVKLKKGDKEGALADFKLAMQLRYPGADKLFKEAKEKK